MNIYRISCMVLYDESNESDKNRSVFVVVVVVVILAA